MVGRKRHISTRSSAGTSERATKTAMSASAFRIASEPHYRAIGDEVEVFAAASPRTPRSKEIQIACFIGVPPKL